MTRGSNVRRAALALAALLTVSTNDAKAASGDTNGYAGKGQLVVRTSIGGAGNDITVGGDIALEERGAFLRVDILSLAIPGADATLSSLLSTQLFPPGGFTIVYDRDGGTYTVWSTAKSAYYTTAAAGGSAPPPAAAPAQAALGAVGDIFGAFAFAKSLKNDSAFTASVSLAGHGTVNGHPATGLDYQYSRTTNGDTTEIHGRLQLADDLDAVPVQITASGKAKSFPQSSLRLDLTTLAKRPVADDDFRVPPGYARSADIGGVIGKTLPH